jgi:hypothetical protein
MNLFTDKDSITHDNFVWALSYVTADQENISLVDRYKKYIKGPIFGCSSSLGVFNPYGFKRGAYFLAAKKEDNIQVYPVIKMAMEKTAFNIAKMSAKEIKDNFGIPDIILMHATPGFEERIIDGITDILGENVPIYGGSAGDDNLEGKWFIFKDSLKIKEGFLLVGIKSNNIYCNFISEYVPTDLSGIVTKSNYRTIYEIDNKPAAVVYNEWTNGLISKYVANGGIIYSLTSNFPIGQVYGRDTKERFYLLAHPYMVLSVNNGITFFSEIKEGERIWLMKENKTALFDRINSFVQYLKNTELKMSSKGSILIYCAGIIKTMPGQANLITDIYKKVIKNTPFIGAATIGEQGYFKGNVNKSFHGNLMFNTIVF